LGDNFFYATSDIFVGHAQKADAEFLFQDLLPVGVPALNAFDLVNASIHFHGELYLAAVKVEPERTNTVLTPEVQAAAAVIPQSLPQVLLRRCRRVPRLPRKRSQHLTHCFFHDRVLFAFRSFCRM